VETRPAGAGAKAEAPVMAATARTRVNFILIFFVGLINLNNLDYVSREWAFGMHLSIKMKRLPQRSNQMLAMDSMLYVAEQDSAWQLTYAS
jgi:hypothetical protein